MRLYLVQHAKALSSDVDPLRSLSEEGRREAQKIADFLTPLNLAVDYIWHSEKTRAAQTAEILARALTVRVAVAQTKGLAPNDDVGAVKTEIEAEQGDVMIVGHMPFVNRLASLLLTGRESDYTVAFRNAGVVCFNRLDGKNWRIEWAVTPELITGE